MWSYGLVGTGATLAAPEVVGSRTILTNITKPSPDTLVVFFVPADRQPAAILEFHGSRAGHTRFPYQFAPPPDVH